MAFESLTDRLASVILVRIFPPPCVLLFFARLLTSCCKKLPPDRSVSDFLHPSVALRVSRALPQNPVKRRYEVVCLGHSFLPAPSENFQNLRTKKRPQIYLAFRLYHRLGSFVNTFLHSLLVSFCKQISCSHENLLTKRYEGSAAL